MKNRIVTISTLLLCALFVVPQAFAGGIDNKQNLSARYLATGSRNAATDGVDIAAYNPAGIVLQQEGVAIGVDAHYIWKDYEQTFSQITDMTGQVTRDQDEPSLVPGLFAKYSKDNWGLFGSMTINGGGGKVKYDQGNIITNTIEASLFSKYNPLGVLSNQSVEAESYYLTYTAGASYKFCDYFSSAFGLRYVDATKNIDASADINAALSPDGQLVGAYEETADGWGWILSMDVKPTDDLLFAIRYESKVELEFTTDFGSKTNDLGAITLANLSNPKTDGGKSNRDLPALLGLGVAWDVNDKLNLNSSFTYYFEEDANWDGKEDDVNSNSWDWGFSGTYSLRDNLRISLGYMYTHIDYDADDFDIVAQMSPPLSAHSFFGGVGYDVNQALTLNFSAMINSYDEDGTIGVTTAEYDKTNAAVAVGLEYKF